VYDNSVLLDLVKSYEGTHKTVLDLGSGTGQNVPLPETFRYHGVDISEIAIAAARKAARPNATFEVADVAEYTTTEKYDIIMLREVLYYLPAAAQRSLLARMPEMLNPDGIVITQIWSVDAYRDQIEMIRGLDELRIITEPARTDGGSTLVLGLA
jgi:trans-aconitate methyltransferase